MFAGEVVTPPTHLPITTTDEPLAAAVTEELERVVLWRAIVRQTRRIVIDGPLPPRIDLEPVAAITSITRWTTSDDAAVIDEDVYHFVSRDPAGTILMLAPGHAWPSPGRAIGSFSLTYTCGWEVSPESSPGAGDGTNAVPPSVLSLMLKSISLTLN